MPIAIAPSGVTTAQAGVIATRPATTPDAADQVLAGHTDKLPSFQQRFGMRGVIGRVTEVGPVGESIVRALERIYRDKQLGFAVLEEEV